MNPLLTAAQEPFARCVFDEVGFTWVAFNSDGRNPAKIAKKTASANNSK
jgi:hypothetical protein